MKQESVRRALSGGFWSASAVALVLVAWLAAGCGPRTEDQAAVDLSEVRGEPIQAAPVEPAIAEGAAVSGHADGTEDSKALVAAEASGESAVTNLTAEVALGEGSEVEVAAVTEAKAQGEGEGEGEMKGTPEHPLEVGFDRLAAFQYDLPEGPVDTEVVKDTGASAQIPSSIKGLNEQFIALKGFMLPLKVEKGLVTELLLMRDQSMCCYGTVPRINEWVSVKMVGAGVKPLMDQAVTLFGKFKVGEMYENGYLVGIYEMAGERMAGALDM